MNLAAFEQELRDFHEFGQPTILTDTQGVVTFVNEFWTSKQRAAHSLHEISYRACFKPQLPRFFIERFTRVGDVVYDPFMGRGTTLLESALMGRVPFGGDVNPLGDVLLRPRLQPPTTAEVVRRLQEIDFQTADEFPEDLLVFYHPETLTEICALKRHLQQRKKNGTMDAVDRWIRMVAVNRLTGHSPGFFSVYTLPPNQAVSVESQRKINAKRQQTPPRRNVAEVIVRKTRSLLADGDEATRKALGAVADNALILTQHAAQAPQIVDESVHLVVTSPPFLDVVDYAADNALRCWFCGMNAGKIPITVISSVEQWQVEMRKVFVELQRVLVPDGCVAFEVGEVKSGRVRLEEIVLRAAASTPLEPVLVLINDQKFTKTANCWGVQNNAKGTNTNRIVLLRKRR
jgi:hypothetical protein